MNAKSYVLPYTIAVSIVVVSFTLRARAQVACLPPPTGLVSWWSFDGNATDQHGLNSGTLGGNPAFGAGKVAGALIFDGTDDEVVVPPSTSLNVGTGGGFTVEGWIKPQNPNQQQPIVEWNDRQGTVGVMLWLSQSFNGDLYANVIDSGNVSHDFRSSGGLVTASDWYHVALSYSRTTGQAVIYLNGNVAAQQNIGSFPVQTSFELFFGRRIHAGGGSAWFAGMMDEWGLYNRSLDPAEVQAIFSAGSAGKCKNPVTPPPACLTAPSGLVGWWPWNQTASDVISGSNAVLLVGPNYFPGRVGPALRFDGVDDSARIAATPALDVGAGSGLTVEAWIRPENVQTPGALVEWSGPTGDLGVHLYVAAMSPGSLFANLIDTNNSPHFFTTPPGLVVTGQWQHVALTYDRTGGVARLFLNGTSIVQQTVGTFRPQTRPDLQIGQRVMGGAAYHYRGGLDELSLYNRALTASQIAQIARVGSGGKCLTNTMPPLGTNCVLEGLVSWWRGDGNANDSFGNNDGQLRNGAGFAAGVVGQGFNLNGSGQFVLVPDSATLDLTNELTVEMWFKADDFNGRPLFDKRDGSSGNYGTILDNVYGVELFYDDPTVVDGDFPGGVEISAYPTLPSAGVFHHFGSTFRQAGANQVELKYYLDGALLKTRTIAGSLGRTVNAAPLSIGAEAGGSGAVFKGVIDEVGLYRRALSLAEMQSIHGAGANGKCHTNGPAPSTRLRVVSVTAPSESVVSVPIQIDARGNENAFSFSLEFNPALLAFRSAAPRAGLAGVTLIVNSNDAGAGRLGFALALPASTALPSGTQELMRVEFQVGSNPGTVQVAFGDAPVSRQVADALAHSLPAEYISGAVTVTPAGFEADVAPRPRGDGTIAAIDWVQVGRFVANLDTPAPGEFVRADCAPRVTGGNGMISAADFVQTGRYLAALDPLTPAGGPAGPAAGGIGGFQPAGAPVSKVSMINVNVAPASTFVVPVRLQAEGRENALGFSIVFDPSKMLITGVASGADATSASLNLNTSLEASGKLGVLLGLSAGQSFGAGSREVLLLSFVAAGDAAGNGSVSFSDDVVLREVADVNADGISASFVAGTVTFGVVTPPGPPLSFWRTGDLLLLAWPGSAAGFQLEGTTGALGTPWTTISSFTLGGQRMAIVPITGGGRYFRLKKP